MGWLDFCKEEIERANLLNEKGDFYGGFTGKALLELCEVFSNQDHSGMSAGVVSSLFSRLVKSLPLTPLTGTDDEWIEVGENLYQNKRCPSVFKENGKAYQHDYYIFVEPNGVCYTSSDSKKEITSFPYWPDHEYIKVNKKEREDD